MISLHFLSHLIEQYGLYGVLVLVMFEGDLTLLLAGVLAHTGFFDDGVIQGYGFAKLLLWGTLGGFVSDNLAYCAGRRALSMASPECLTLDLCRCRSAVAFYGFSS